MTIKENAAEKLRKIWTPGKEVEELLLSLDPQTELDSMIRDLLHRTIQQKGPVSLDYGCEARPVLNSGSLRWEIVHGPNTKVQPQFISRQISIWVEDV